MYNVENCKPLNIFIPAIYSRHIYILYCVTTIGTYKTVIYSNITHYIHMIKYY